MVGQERSAVAMENYVALSHLGDVAHVSADSILSSGIVWTRYMVLIMFPTPSSKIGRRKISTSAR